MIEQNETTGDDLPAEEFDDPLSDYEQSNYDDALEKILAEEKVSGITARPCPRLAPGASVKEALDILADFDVSCLLVEEDGKLKGIFSEWDVLRKVAGKYDDPASANVGEVMTEDPVFVYETDPTAAALSVVALCGYRHVPVLDLDEKVVGMVTPRRIMAFLKDKLP